VIYAQEQTARRFKAQCQRLTGITDEHKLIAFTQKTFESNSYHWRTQFHEKATQKGSDYRIALGIGLHLLSQIYAAYQGQLKTDKNRKGYLSLNRVISDVVGKGGQKGQERQREYFDGFRPSKHAIERSFYQYRSILPLILGHLSARMGLQDHLDIGALTFLSAHALQHHLIEMSQTTFTPRKKEQLFSVNNVAIVPKPSDFLSETKMLRNIALMLTPNGRPILYLKGTEQKVIDHYQSNSQ
jgi:hypothetical protein